MKIKSILYCLLLLLLGSCSSYKLNNTVWYGEQPTEVNGETGTIVNVLFFDDNNNVFQKNAVMSDTTFIVEPIFTSTGKFQTAGKRLKNGIGIEIKEDKTIVGKGLNFQGLITPEGMVLVSSDSITTFYKKLD